MSKVSVQSADAVTIHGTVEPGFEPVREVFAENFHDRNELGAAIAVYSRGELVVDLWGGYRDTDHEHPWEADTMVLVASGTKGMTAAAIAVALSRGLFALDDRIADYWPAFAQHGKGEVTVRQLLSHQAGLATLDGRLSPEQIADTEFLSGLLASEKLDWVPGTRHGYHAFTLGWYASELLRHTDGRTLGQFFADEVAEPLDLEFYIGLPEKIPTDRVADLDAFGYLDMLLNLRTLSPRFVLSFFNPWSVTNRALNVLDTRRPADLNSPAFRAVEIPSGNGIGTARAMARLYGELATGGEALGLDKDVFAELTAPPVPPSGDRRDVVIGMETAYAMGYSKPSPDFRFGTSDASFGTPGAGGSFGFADPDVELGFAYTPNRLGLHLKDDPREMALREAVYECIERRSQETDSPRTRF
ncbi:beta-lactamase family protein [Halogeometricum sp. S1BR25-6]|uniref:Beta-lactamase family protein n=1 Tax=Halogeometricum salsisoli TaxID=2950536 RepID=A0ABU2GJW1_9EURY|nr:serine hydrolase domain-containing protein [Halogeometricum sp. S1BR25-6]MDS0301105.1 beta-lactamase family protein [Halogeometricum sp. S1BR25-6]